jgi:hypothetical protein
VKLGAVDYLSKPVDADDVVAALLCVEENKMSYHIEINEYQRRLIMKALSSTDVNQFSQAPGSSNIQYSATFSYALLMDGSLLAPRAVWRRLLSVDKCPSLMTYADGSRRVAGCGHARRPWRPQ